jgi:hypothetical protein
MRHDVTSEKVSAEAASRQAAKIGVIASPFLAAARPNSNIPLLLVVNYVCRGMLAANPAFCSRFN